MEQETSRLNPSPTLENTDLEQRWEKKLKDVKKFNNSINHFKGRIIYFKERYISRRRNIENRKS